MPYPSHEDPASGASRKFWDQASLGFVLLVWLAALLATQVYIGTYAARTPAADDVSIFMPGAGQMPFWHWLWALHNEHRLPLPKLVQLGLYELSGDIRSGMYAEAQIYAATALGCILAARKLRGSTRPWDAFFPLMWLQLGNSENLLMGFSLCFAIPTACVCLVFFLGVLSPARLAPSRAILCALALLALPLCGGNGLLPAPALGAWTAWLGWSGRRNADPRLRRGAWIHVAGALLTAAVCAAYVLGFVAPAGAEYKLGLRSVLRSAFGTLSLAFGPEYVRWWPASGWLIFAATLAVVYLLVRRLRATRGADPVALGTLAVLAAVASLILGIALGRPSGTQLLLANRYMPLPAPFFVALSLGALALAAQRARELVLIACCLAMLAATPDSIRYGGFTGNVRREQGQRLDDLVSADASAARVHAQYTQDFMTGQPMISSWVLDYWARNGLAPFDDRRDHSREDFRFLTLETTPLDIEGEPRPATRMLDGELVLCVAPPAKITFRIDELQHGLVGFVGAPDQTVASGVHPGIRARAFLLDPQGASRELGQLTFDPVHEPAQRGMQRFEFAWAPGPTGKLVLAFEAVDDSEAGRARGWVKLRGVRVE